MDKAESKPDISAGQITRREVLKCGLVGAAGLTLLPTVLAACNNSATPSSTATPTPTPTPAPTPSPTSASYLGRQLSGGLKIGSNHADAADKAGLDAVNSAFAAATGLAPTLNTVDHNTFADQVGNYIAATPDDCWTWFSGFRMRSFADEGLILPIEDVWANVKGNFTAGFAKSVVDKDGRIYGIPVDFYPWCMFYRKSVWAAKGYAVPTTWDELLTLCGRMQKDGLTPIAFGDKDGWPAMGTFDILNLRLNGYDFHVGLLAGTEKWTDARVTTAFEAWRKLVPYSSSGFADLTWQRACDTLVRKMAGMYFLGLFITGEVATVDSTAMDDIDFFPFPYFGNDFDVEKAIDAPVDIWTLCAKSPTLPADADNAKAYLEFWARGSTQLIMYNANNGYIPTASDTDLTRLDRLTQKAVAIVGEAKRITQFLDRDTRPDFAGASGMQGFLLDFVKTPDQDLAVFQTRIQDFWDALPEWKG